MIAEAEAAAEEIRNKADTNIKAAEEKAAKAAEDIRSASADADLADSAVGQAASALQGANDTIKAAEADRKAAIQKRFDSHKAALTNLAQEVVSAGFGVKGVQDYLNSVLSTANSNFVKNGGANPEWGFGSLEKGWTTLTGYLKQKNLTAKAQAQLEVADELGSTEEAAAAKKKSEGEEQARQAEAKKSEAAVSKQEAEKKKSEAEAKQREAETEKAAATKESEGAGAVVEEAKKKAAAAANRVIAAVSFGAASRSPVNSDTVPGLSTEQKAARRKIAENREKATAAVLGSFKDHPDLAETALDVIHSSDHPEAFVEGIEKVGQLVAGNFKGQAANAKEARDMAKNALKMAGAIGGDYLARMDAYYATDAASKPDTLRTSDTGKTALNYTGALGGALIGPDGGVNPEQKAFDAIVANLNFHPSSLKNPLPNLARHIDTFRKKVSNDQIGATMKGISQKPQGGAMSLVCKTLGVADHTKVGAQEARVAVLSAALTPLTQGPVGSCFATCNCMDYQEKKPAEFMADLAEIVTKGTLSKGLDTVPVIQNIPPGENGLLRGFEYTVATLGARQASSARKQKISDKAHNGFIAVQSNASFKKLNVAKTQAEKGVAAAKLKLDEAKENEAEARRLYNAAIVAKDRLFAAYELEFKKDPSSAATKSKEDAYDLKVTDMNAKFAELDVAKAATLAEARKVADEEAKVSQADTDWARKEEALKVASAAAVTWEYDPTMVRTGSPVAADGSSSKGGWVMQRASDRAPITNDAELKACLAAAFKTTLGPDVNDADIATVVGLPGFINSMKKVKAGAGTVFKEETGGQEKDSKKVLTGKENEEKSIVANTGATGASQTKALLSSLVDNLKDTPEETVTLGVAGAHSERALPRHPSLDALKTGPGDVASKIDAAFTKSAEVATNSLKEDHMKHLFAKSGNSILKDWLGDSVSDIVSSDTAPTGALKPAELKTKIYDSVSALVSARFRPPGDALKMLEEKIDSFLLDELFPQFVVADTNWGDATGKVFHVVAPDLATGEPKLYKKDERTGAMSYAGDKYVNTAWDARLDKATTT